MTKLIAIVGMGEGNGMAISAPCLCHPWSQLN